MFSEHMPASISGPGETCQDKDRTDSGSITSTGFANSTRTLGWSGGSYGYIGGVEWVSMIRMFRSAQEQVEMALLW